MTSNFQTPPPVGSLADLADTDPIPDLSQYNMGDLRSMLAKEEAFLPKTRIRAGSYPDNSISASKLNLPFCFMTTTGGSVNNATLTTFSNWTVSEEVNEVNSVSMFSNNTLVAPIQGVYHIGLFCSFAAAAPAGDRLMGLYIDGNLIRQWDLPCMNGAGLGANWHAAHVTRLLAGQSVYMDVYQTTGGALNCNQADLSLVCLTAY